MISSEQGAPAVSVNLAELIRSRRSINLFRPEPLPSGLIESILETAVYAPNHRLTQPWRFVVMTGATRTRYAEIRREMAMPALSKLDESMRAAAIESNYQKFAHVPAYLLVIMTISSNAEIAEEDYAACAALIENVLLLAWAQGVGSCWKTFKDDPRLRALVGLQANERVVGIIHLGYPVELPVSTRKSAAERLTYLS